MSTPTRRDIADQVVGACRELGTTHAFGMPGGGSNLDVAGACDHYGVEFVLVHAETAAAVMAAVAGELTGAPGIAVATRGPGAASAANGVAQALVDRQPLLMITDCVAVADAERVSHQRIDQQALFEPIALASVVLDGRDAQVAADCVALTLGSPPGPVHVDIDPTATPTPVPPRPRPAATDPGPLLDRVRSARRPVIAVGLGAAVSSPSRRAAIAALLDEVGRRTHVPVLCTYKAKGMVPDTAPWCAGLLTGATIEGPVLASADLVIGIGLDPVEYIPAPWPHTAPVVLAADWPVADGSRTSSTFMGDRVAGEAIGDLVVLVEAITAALGGDWEPGSGQAFRQAALTRIREAVSDGPQAGMAPQEVVAIASDEAPPGTIATVDAGAHMLVAMPLWEVDGPGQALISSGWATMGFALPAAIAAALTRPGTPVVCFTGDGGLGMVLAELETVARLALPITVVVFNDSALSLIAAKQSPTGHGGERAVTYAETDFAAIAQGCGVESVRVSDAAAYRAAVAAALASGRPRLIDAVVDPSSYPAILSAIRG